MTAGDPVSGLPLPLTGPGVVLRPLQADDAPGLFRVRNDPVLARYQGWARMSLADAQAFVAEMGPLRWPPPGDWWQLAIADGEGALVGDLGLCDRGAGDLEVGITLARHAHGRGLATRALDTLLDALRWCGGVGTVHATTDARNGACVRLLERVGFVLQARRPTRFRGEACVELDYAFRVPG